MAVVRRLIPRRAAVALLFLLLLAGCRSDWEADRGVPATISADATPYDFGPYWLTPTPGVVR